MSVVVYWIRHKDHTDMFSEGYIGISKQVEKRFEDHKKRSGNKHLKNAINLYGWENLIKEVILKADEAYCLLIESQLRAKDKIGWNIVKGGGKPPVTKWNLGKTLSKKIRDKISASRKGKKHTPETEALVTQNLLIYGIKTRFKQGMKPIRKELTCPHCNKVGLTPFINRWHMNNCKFKEQQ